MIFCDAKTVGIGASFRTHEWKHGTTDGQTDVEVEIVYCFLFLINDAELPMMQNDAHL